MISLAITNYNRSDWVIESFFQVIDNPLISEIVIVDDCSDEGTFNKLSIYVSWLRSDKVRVVRNSINLGILRNKVNAVRECKNDEVILLDSDNIIDNDFVNALGAINKEPDVLYCPETLTDNAKKVQWTYAEFNTLIVDKNNINSLISNVNFETHMNTGNYFLNRERFLRATSRIEPLLSKTCPGDSMYLYYLWLLDGNRVKIIPGLSYVHRVHDGSWYVNHYNEAMDIIPRIKNLFNNFPHPQPYA